jgi:hypothetical protein
MASSQNRQSNEQLIVVLASWLAVSISWQEKSGLAAFSRLSRGEGLHASELGDNGSAPYEAQALLPVYVPSGNAEQVCAGTLI